MTIDEQIQETQRALNRHIHSGQVRVAEGQVEDPIVAMLREVQAEVALLREQVAALSRAMSGVDTAAYYDGWGDGYAIGCGDDSTFEPAHKSCEQWAAGRQVDANTWTVYGEDTATVR